MNERTDQSIMNKTLKRKTHTREMKTCFPLPRYLSYYLFQGFYPIDTSLFVCILTPSLIY